MGGLRAGGSVWWTRWPLARPAAFAKRGLPVQQYIVGTMRSLAGLQAMSRTDTLLRSAARLHGTPQTTVWSRCSARHRRACFRPAQAKQGGDNIPKYIPPREVDASLRAEAEAPFRSFRLAIFGAATVSATLATLFNLPQLAATVAGAAGAKSWGELGQDFAINVTALAVCAYLVRADLKARDKQLARLQREEKLGALQLELANGKVLRLAQLRSFSRVVMVAGTLAQVQAALQAAEPFRQALQDRGVLVVGLPVFKGGEGEEQGGQLPRPTAEELRWRATPLRLDDWAAWFREQAALANASTERGLYVGLRLDGRVRNSGTGCPPWQKLALQLPPVEGIFGVGGFLDGMDGRV